MRTSFCMRTPAPVVHSCLSEFSIAVRELRDAEGLNEAWLQVRLLARAGTISYSGVSFRCLCV
jgi:hypothetical protein